jgi:hypothetical protein
MSARPVHARVARRAAALLLGALLLLPAPAAATGLGPIEGGALPGPLPLFPPTIATAKTSANTSAVISASSGGSSKAATLSIKKSRR